MKTERIGSVVGVAAGLSEERRCGSVWFAFDFEGEGSDFRVGAVARCRDGVCEYLRSYHDDWQPMAGQEFYNDVTREKCQFQGFETFTKCMNGFGFDTRESFEEFLVPSGPAKNWFGDEIAVME